MSIKNKIVFATNNLHKLSEIREIIGDKYTILSLKDKETKNKIITFNNGEVATLLIDSNNKILSLFIITHFKKRHYPSNIIIISILSAMLKNARKTPSFSIKFIFKISLLEF